MNRCNLNIPDRLKKLRNAIKSLRSKKDDEEEMGKLLKTLLVLK